MSNENFMRRYILRCGKMGSNGFEIGHINSASEDALHISFSIEKSDTESANTAKVQIWNLSNKNLKVLDSKDCILELKAGYGENTPLALVGSISSVITTRDNADRMTEIEVVDGRVGLRDANVSISMNGKVNSKKVYELLANKMGMPMVFASDLKFKTFPKGFSFVGKARTCLQKLATYNKHRWTIQNEIIQITNPGKAISSRAFLLNKETGLIGIPKQITLSTDANNSKTRNGYEIEYLMNCSIGVNDVIELDSSTAKGYFRVYKLTIDGDNLEGDWCCTAQVLKIK